MKRKLLAVMLTAVMAVSIVGCGNASSGESSGTSPSTPDSASNQGNSEVQSDADNSTGDGVVTLRFASWALGTAEENNIERQMIAAFEKSHPNIKIEIAEEITGDWNGALATAAAGGSLPDVSSKTSRRSADFTDKISSIRPWPMME